MVAIGEIQKQIFSSIIFNSILDVLASTNVLCMA